MTRPTTTALAEAAVDGDVTAVRRLLGAGAPVNRRTPAGLTPLGLAAYRDGNGRAVRALLAAGADPNVAARDGTTPLIAAVHHGHRRIDRLLGRWRVAGPVQQSRRWYRRERRRSPSDRR